MDTNWPWIVRNPWLRSAFRERRDRDSRDFDGFASEVQAVIRNLGEISEADVERVRARIEQGLGPDRPWSSTGTATVIGMAIGYLLAQR